jgi:hypothetical protein
MRIEWNDLAIGRVDHCEIPQQHINPEFPITTHQIVQEVSEARRGGIASIEAKTAIKLPAGYQNKTPCVFQR